MYNYLHTFYSDLLPLEASKVKLLEGAANNLPDEAAEKTAYLIAELASSLTKDDLLVTLISGNAMITHTVLYLLSSRGINWRRKYISTNH